LDKASNEKQYSSDGKAQSIGGSEEDEFQSAKSQAEIEEGYENEASHHSQEIANAKEEKNAGNSKNFPSDRNKKYSKSG